MLQNDAKIRPLCFKKFFLIGLISAEMGARCRIPGHANVQEGQFLHVFAA